MVDRIREILNAHHLSPTQFADMIGVARPIVSHILSGRNKPSLEVVQKIVAAFPELSLPWLLSGTGSMEASTAPVTVAPPPPTRRLAPKTPETPRPATNRSTPDSMDATAAASATEVPANATVPSAKSLGGSNEAPDALPLVSAPLAAPTPATSAANEYVSPAVALSQPVDGNTANKVAAGADASQALHPAEKASALGVAQLVAEPNKAIRRIVIFYQDGTFSDYQPEKN